MGCRNSLCESALENYQTLAEAKLNKFLIDRGDEVVNPDYIPGDTLIPTEISKKEHLYFSGDKAYFTLPGAQATSSKQPEVSGIPILPDTQPSQIRSLLNKDSIYRDDDVPDLNIAGNSDTYEDNEGNLYRAYDIRSWSGMYRNHYGWASGRSIKTTHGGPGGREDIPHVNPVDKENFVAIIRLNPE